MSDKSSKTPYLIEGEYTLTTKHYMKVVIIADHPETAQAIFTDQARRMDPWLGDDRKVLATFVDLPKMSEMNIKQCTEMDDYFEEAQTSSGNMAAGYLNTNPDIEVLMDKMEERGFKLHEHNTPIEFREFLEVKGGEFISAFYFVDQSSLTFYKTKEGKLSVWQSFYYLPF